MPRLSIIIPRRQDDQRLEATLLSVLENRPEDSEILVVHDGTYPDLYQLSDEVVFVEEEAGSNLLHLLNAGIMAACSPAICVVLDGVIVSPDWAVSPMHMLSSPGTVAVAVAVQDVQAGRVSYGIDARVFSRPNKLRGGRVEAEQASDSCAGPTLACGFYRRKTVLSLGGWNEALDDSVADFEFARALHTLGQSCVCDIHSAVQIISGAPSRKLSPLALSQLSSLSIAHGNRQVGMMDGLKSLLADCLTGNVLQGVAWAKGKRDTSTIRRTQMRLAHAKQQLAALAQEDQTLRIFPAQLQNRRAA